MASGSAPVARAFRKLVCLLILALVTTVDSTVIETQSDSLQDTFRSTFPSGATTRDKPNCVKKSGGEERDLSFKRKLRQETGDSPSTGESLSNLGCENITSFYNESSRAWILDDEALADINNDVQLILDCAIEGDTLLFQTRRPIRPTTSLIISKNLTLGSLENTEFAQNRRRNPSTEKTRLNCPEFGQLIISRSQSFTLRDVAIEGCNSKSNLIDLELNRTQPAMGTIRLLRVAFERNELSGDARILNSGTPLCYQLELENVVIEENLCSKESCVMLSSQNILRNVELYRNQGDGDSSPEQSIFLTPEGSEITATNVTSEENRIRSFHLSNSTLNLTDSHFSHNTKSQSSGTRANSIGGGVLCSNNSTLFISDTIFENNSAFNGGGLIVFSSNVNISGCAFEENNANDGNGGAIYSHHRSSLDISSSRFSRNRGYRGAVIYSEDTFMVTIVNSSILENRCSRSCSVHISGGTVSIRECEFRKNIARQIGGAFCAATADVTLDKSSFIGNNASGSGGGCVFRSKSRVQAKNLTFRNNIAFDNDGGGGGIHLSSRSQLQIRDSLFSENEAVKGGAIFAFSKSLLVLSHSIFISNQAGYGNAINMDECDNGSISDCNFTNHSHAYHGGVLYFESGNNGTISNCNFTHNRVGNRAGVIYLDGFNNAIISNSNFTNNRAYEGGALYMDFSKNGQVLNCNFINNTASNGGVFGIYIVSSLSVFDSVFSSNEARGNGVVHLLDSNLTLQSVTMTNNSAETGGALYAYRANINITNSTFEKSSASRSGGSIYMDQSNATLEDMTLQSNEAVEDCGGVCVYKTSYLNASNLTIQSSSAGNMGGGIAMDNSSSVLCYSCIILNNTALRGAGMHVYSDDSIKVVAKLQDSRFESNIAKFYGGGIAFATPSDRSINCKNSKNTCGHIVLLHTIFVKNYANHSGAAILTTRASGILINCDKREKNNP